MNNKALRPALSGLFLALAMLLPFITASDPKIGNMFLPMHIPVMLCGFICGPLWGAAAGLAAPLLRSLLFSAPVFFPNAAVMAPELMVYGLVCGLVYEILPKRFGNIYLSLIAAMLAGRMVWGLVSLLVIVPGGNSFGFEAFLSGAFLSALPGIALQLIIIPPIVLLLKKRIKI